MKIITVEIDRKKIRDYYFEAELELKNTNRFSNEKLDDIVDYIISCEVNKTFLRKGHILYRARIYGEFDADIRYADESENEFKGYDDINSYVNLNFNDIKDGRCNPSGISYLYASNSEQCCIHEIRPSIDAYVNVSAIEVCDRLNILNLSTDTIVPQKMDSKRILPGIDNGFTCQYLYELFKRPNQYRNDYLITQYVSEKIKNNGYDGIKYTSSLYNGESNTNYVIFSYEKCHAINSKLYKIIANKITYK